MAAPDQVSIDDISVGYEWKPTLGDLQARQPGFGQPGAPVGRREGDWVEDEVLDKWKLIHKPVADALRAILKACGCRTAADIEKLGCTGIAQHPVELFAARAATSVALTNYTNVPPLPEKLDKEQRMVILAGQFVRIGLGGSGVGLPCFVPPTRFCLVHSTIGGLQEGQDQRHGDYADAISRELTPAERGRVELTEAARHEGGKDRGEQIKNTQDILAGRALPDGFEEDEESVLRDEGDDIGPEEILPPRTATQVASDRGVAVRDILFVCPDHTFTNWDCRYCVAQMVVEGPYDPKFHVEDDFNDDHYHADAAGVLEVLAKTEVTTVRVYVLAASFTRKLARVR